MAVLNMLDSCGGATSMTLGSDESGGLGVGGIGLELAVGCGLDGVADYVKTLHDMAWCWFTA